MARKKAGNATWNVTELLNGAPRVLQQIQRPDAIYLGPCIVQDPGAWTRMGPTWYVPGIGRICVGPGVSRWGTKLGLAELATTGAPTPVLHAVGVSIGPSTNIVYAMLQEAVDARDMTSHAAEAETLELTIRGAGR